MVVIQLRAHHERRVTLVHRQRQNDSEAYSYALKYFRDLGRDAGYTAVNDRRIDYLFGPTEAVLLRRAEVLRDAGVGQMDHWPLLIEVAL